jgi:hypothetical protein
MPDEKAFEERILNRIPLEILALSLALAVPVFIIFSPAAAGVFFLGGAASAVGFIWLRKSLSSALDSGKKGALRAGLGLYLVRLLLICALFLSIILIQPKRALAFGAGFSVLVLVTLVEGVWALLQMRKWKN